MLVFGLKKTEYELDPIPFAIGGEGYVYKVLGSDNQVVKLYHQDRIASELEEKLKMMMRKPPNPPIIKYTAWPLDMRIIGFQK